MELLKSNLIIDKKYKPSKNMSHIDYFNRAMVFAQTNYQDYLDKVVKTIFCKISPTRFFEEYVWTICCINSTIEDASKIFLSLNKEIKIYCHGFWDLNNVPNSEEMVGKLFDITNNILKAKAIDNAFLIINKGIRLYGWEFYRNNFLNTIPKLTALPMIYLDEAQYLAKGIGLRFEVGKSVLLQKLAKHWGFSNTEELLKNIQKCFPMSLKMIELIMFYATETFKVR